MHYKNLVLSACLRCSLKLKLIIMFCVFIFKLVSFRIINKYAFFILKLSLSTLLPSPSSFLRILPSPTPSILQPSSSLLRLLPFPLIPFLPSCNPHPPLSSVSSLFPSPPSILQPSSPLNVLSFFCWTNPFAYSAFAATTARTSPMYCSW